MKFPLRLKARITLGTLAVLLICSLVGSGFFLDRERERLEHEIRNRGQTLAFLVAQFSAVPIEKYSFFIVQEVARNVEEQQGIVFCEIYDNQDKSLVQIDITIHGKQIVKKRKLTEQDILIIKSPITKENKHLGTVEIGLELSSVNEEMHTYMIRLALGILCLLIAVGFLINLFLSYAFVTPVVHLSEVVQHLGRGEFEETGIARRNDEIGDLARSFNEMSQNLKQLYRNLENKVVERTADLALTNQRLEDEIVIREKTEDALKTAKEAAEQATRYKSNFIAHMSHEIRTPLNAILGYAQILQSRDDLDEQTRKAIEAIDRAGGHLLGIINDILDLAKIEAGRMELKPASFDLCLLLRSMASLFELRCLDKSLDWQITGIDTSRILPVIADAGKLRQILINLLGNAVKFTDKGGVTLRVIHHTRDLYRFSIEDTGPGIPHEHRQRIVEPFSELSGAGNQESTGLGLSITCRFLEMMDTRLEIEDNLPHGAKFSFTIELPPADRSTLPIESPQDKIQGLESATPLTALVVDDDKLSRTMLSHLLTKADIACIEAEDGVEALQILTETRPDIIFMDRFMPKMDGIETITCIKRDHQEQAPPIVMITAAALDSGNEATDTLDIDGMIIKPLDINQVFQCMSEVLGLPLKCETANVGSVKGADNKTEQTLPGTVRIPADLHEQLLAAAEFGKVSQLKGMIKVLEETPEVDNAYTAQLKKHLGLYELSAIVALLEQTDTL